MSLEQYYYKQFAVFQSFYIQNLKIIKHLCAWKIPLSSLDFFFKMYKSLSFYSYHEYILCKPSSLSFIRSATPESKWVANLCIFTFYATLNWKSYIFSYSGCSKVLNMGINMSKVFYISTNLRKLNGEVRGEWSSKIIGSYIVRTKSCFIKCIFLI